MVQISQVWFYFARVEVAGSSCPCARPRFADEPEKQKVVASTAAEKDYIWHSIDPIA